LKGVNFRRRLKKVSQKENQREERKKGAKTVTRVLGTKIWKLNVKVMVKL
jgi:ribosomal protein L37AE/L43A